MSEKQKNEANKENKAVRSWFCVFNNPEKSGYTGTPEEVCKSVIDHWVTAADGRAAAAAFCVSAKGLNHLHVVLESKSVMRFSSVKKAFPAMHIEPTKGNKSQVEDYIHKRGKFAEKGEKVIHIEISGELQGKQGKRTDLEAIESMIADGKTPNEIMGAALKYRRYERMIKGAYYQKRAEETPILRKVRVIWHVGESGSGKSYTLVKLAEKHGENDVYFMTDYDHGFDRYNGEKVLFMDEFRGQLRYAQLLTVLDGYKSQVAARYANVLALWDEVHITSVLPPEKVYAKMVEDDRNLDTIEQLKRRIDEVVYHYKVDGEYEEISVNMKDYRDYEDLKYLGEGGKLVELKMENEQMASSEWEQMVFGNKKQI